MNLEGLKKEFKVSDHWIKNNETNLKLLELPLMEGRNKDKITYYFLANETF